MSNIMRCFNIIRAVMLVSLVVLAAGCGGNSDATSERNESVRAGKVHSVTNKDMRVDFVKLMPEQQRQIADELKDGFAVTFQLTDLKGRPIEAGNYSFCGPLDAIDDKGNAYQSFAIATTDVDSGANTLSAHRLMATYWFTPGLDAGADRINVDFKINSIFNYPNTIFKGLNLAESERVEVDGFFLDYIVLEPDQVSISIKPVLEDETRKNVSSAYLLLPSGKQISYSKKVVETRVSRGFYRGALTFPYDAAMSGPVDLVIGWSPPDETWEFNLKNIPVPDREDSAQARREIGALNMDYSRESFFKCIQDNDVYAAGLFIQTGMDPNVTVNSVRESPLMGAAYYGYTDLARLLLENGAYVNIKNENGETALMYAAGEGHLALVELLLQYRADAGIEDNNGETALDFARGNNHSDIVKLLEQGK